MLSLPVKTTLLAYLLLFRLADSRLAAVLAGVALCIAAVGLYYSLIRARRLRARAKQLEQQVEYYTRQNEETHHTRNLFLTNMSHEIRTPMNGLLGMVSLLAQTPVNKEQNDYIATIRSCADTLLTVINNVLHLSAIETAGIAEAPPILAKPSPPKATPVTADTLPRLAEKYPLRILLAEDNPINRQLAVLILDKMGYSPGTAENGKEVLDRLQKEPFDLIFMDIQMPEMDGLEATRQIRAGRGQQPVIIAMTANTTRKDRDDCMTEGMNDFLSKPVHLDELIRMMESWGQTINNARNNFYPSKKVGYHSNY
jgi:CheY-like chemotaxis protein